MAELIDTPLLPEVPSHIRPRHADVTRSLPTTPSPSESDVVRQQALSQRTSTHRRGGSVEEPPLRRVRDTVCLPHPGAAVGCPSVLPARPREQVSLTLFLRSQAATVGK